MTNLPLVKRAHPDSAAGRVLAHAGQRQVLLDGVLRREGAPGRARQLHLPGDDRPRGSGRPDLAHVRRLRRGGREDAARQLGQGAAGAPRGKSPLRLQPDPQVQPDGDRAVQRARRHHRHLGRGAPDAGGQVRAQHAAGAAQRLVHRFHRHAALQARPADPADLRRLRLALRLQALRGGSVHGQAGLREPRREAGHRPARPERPHRRRKVEEADLDPDQTALLEKLLGKDYEVDHGRRPAGQAGRRFRGALLDPLGDRQVDAGVHRQDHLRADVPAHRTALEGEARSA